MKSDPPQFKADAVALYQSRPEATIQQVAADLGINPWTLRNWVRAAGRGDDGRRRRPSRRHQWRRRTPLCARRSVSWRKNARPCARRQSILAGEKRR
ncbi:transposase [Streptomyces sp. HM190]|uniref:transposase n=1 Tax=Streptomyces sp. HM190 TaxID=2695266 RepID=UPI00135ADAFF